MSDLTDTTKRFLASVECVKTHDLFPKRMLVAAYKYSYIFDFEVLFSRDFFSAIKSQLSSGLDHFILVVTEPDPFKYFWKNFNWIPVIIIDQQLDFKDYVRFLNADPGGSPADAIIHNSGRVIVADNNLKMIFMFMRRQEVGIGYFTDPGIMHRIKQAQNFGIIDPQKMETIPDFLRAEVAEYRRNHSLI